MPSVGMKLLCLLFEGWSTVLWTIAIQHVSVHSIALVVKVTWLLQQKWALKQKLFLTEPQKSVIGFVSYYVASIVKETNCLRKSPVAQFVQICALRSKTAILLT